MYILVREDIPPKHQAVQACHAGISAGRELIPRDEQHPNLVVLTVPDEAALMRWCERLDHAQVGYRYFREADMADQVTAVATEPLEPWQRKLFKQLPLLRAA